MNKSGGIFITGTDTGVGKTIISVALLYAFKESGLDCVYMKPVQTGCFRKSGKLIAPDLEFVLSTSEQCPTEKEKKIMAPYLFQPACSPHLAAGLERHPIIPAKIINSFKALKKLHDFVIVEGAGGVLTPFSWQYSMLDLMKALSLPVILIARPGLGTINHTLLALRELRRAKLEIIGIVLNYSTKAKKGIIETSNKTAIERLDGTRVICEFPFVDNLSHAARQLFQKNALEKLAKTSVISDLIRNQGKSSDDELDFRQRGNDTMGRRYH